MSFIKLPINIAESQGGYSLKLYLGSEKKEVLVILDTGSSTLAVKKDSYQPELDKHLEPTSWAQDVTYGKGGWAGPVVLTEIGFSHLGQKSSQNLALKQAPLAIIYDEPEDNFKSVDGIFGLAYHHLNRSYDLTEYFDKEKISPKTTYPWNFNIEHNSSGIKKFKTFLKTHPEHDITPLFTEFEEKNVIPNQFGLLTHRAVSHAEKDSNLAQQIQDPLNQGYFIIGNADHPDHQEHHNGEWQTAKVLHDAYYNTELVSIQVEGFEPIKAPRLQDKHLQTAFTNSIVDSGSSFMMLQSELYQYVMDCFEKIQPLFLEQIKQFNISFPQNKAYKPNDLELHHWPDIHFELLGKSHANIKLTLTAENYWQVNATSAGQMFFTLLKQIPHWPNQSILGLPLMNNYYCIFDRSDCDMGSIHFAKKKDAI